MSESPQSLASALPSVSMLIAFDLEKSYVFKTCTDWGQSKSRGLALGIGPAAVLGCASRDSLTTAAQWDKIFEGCPGWDTKQFPKAEFFAKPLGWTATFTVNPETCPGLAQTFKDLEKKVREAVSGGRPEGEDGRKCVSGIRAVLFPMGIGVLVLEIQLPEDFGALQGLEKALPRKILEERKVIIKEVAGRYAECMEASSDFLGPHSIRLFRAVDRKRIEKEGSAYPVFFVDRSTYETRSEEIRERAGSCPSRPEAPAQTESEAFYAGARVYIGWAEAVVCGYTVGAEGTRSQIERAFIVAMASWYALVVMNFLATLYLMEAFSDLADGGSLHLSQKKRESQARRLAYMEAASASHPIRWTMRERNLRLLETIHRNWSSHQWWSTVEQRTELLALHYDQLENTDKDRRNTWLGVFGAAIAGTTLGSAIADVIGLYPDKAKFASSWIQLQPVFENFGFFGAIMIPLGAIFFVIRWSLRHTR